MKKDGVTKAIDDFLTKNPDATPYTVFATETGVASPIDPNHPGQQWVGNNLDFIKDHRYSAAASYFVPQTDDKYDQWIYDDQMALGLRFNKSPEKVIKDVHIAEGNRWYFDHYKPAKDALLAKATSPHQRRVIEEQFRLRGRPDGAGASFEAV